MSENPPVCEKCGDEYTMDVLAEPTRYCDPCAHELLEARDAEVKALVEVLKRAHADLTEWCNTGEKRRVPIAGVCHHLGNAIEAHAQSNVPKDDDTLDALEEMVAQHCDESGSLHSMGLSSHAWAIDVLAARGRVTITESRGRHRRATWIKKTKPPKENP